MLESLREVVIPEDITCEFIVVDNNSDDDTPLVFEETGRGFTSRIKYVFEHKSGLAYARNRGVREARGEIVAFTDDDVLIDKHWIQHIDRAFKEHYDAAGVGGKILPIWEAPQPYWLNSRWYSYLALMDYGDLPAYMNTPNIWGANMAIKSEMFKKYGLFDPNLGRRPGKLYSHEETDFFRRLKNAGEKLLYYPLAVIYHHIPANRISKNYFRKWRFDEGELQGILLGDAKYLTSMEMPSVSVGRILGRILVSLWKIGCCPSNRFDHELSIWAQLGLLSGRIKGKSRLHGFRASCYLV